MNAVPILAALGVGCGVGRSVLLQAAGALGPALSDRAGHASCPPGREETPGVGCAAFAPELQLAPGPEAGHWLPPSGSERRTGSSDGTTCFTVELFVVATGAANVGATWKSWLQAASIATNAWTRRRGKARTNRVECKKGFLPGRSPAGRVITGVESYGRPWVIPAALRLISLNCCQVG
jgi:hypothetical protein